MQVLHLTLHRKWFDQILAGTKKIEYREIKPYWTKRLFNLNGTPKKFDVIFFKNGYAKDCPKMAVECKGIQKLTLKKEINGMKEEEEVYGIELGKIIKN